MLRHNRRDSACSHFCSFWICRLFWRSFWVVQHRVRPGVIRVRVDSECRRLDTYRVGVQLRDQGLVMVLIWIYHLLDDRYNYSIEIFTFLGLCNFTGKTFWNCLSTLALDRALDNPFQGALRKTWHGKGWRGWVALKLHWNHSDSLHNSLAVHQPLYTGSSYNLGDWTMDHR